MAKSTNTYWNPLIPESDDRWEGIDNTDGLLEQLMLAIDEESGDYTRLTRFKPGADTTAFSSNCHDYPEVHGPFKTDVECIVLEMSYPSQAGTQRVLR